MGRTGNRTYSELSVGDSASLVRTLTHRDIELLSDMAGDAAPLSLDHAESRSGQFRTIVPHGTWAGAMLSAILGTRLPGPGTACVDQSLHFGKPIELGDMITFSVRVTDKDDLMHRITLQCQAVNQRGEDVITGVAPVLAPTEKILRSAEALPEFELIENGRRYERLIAMTRGLEPLRTAIVHPVDSASLVGAIEAARANLIVPVLVGPEVRIHTVADCAQVDLTPYEIVPTEHSEAAAVQAVAMARAGKVQALMKGALHTDELMHAVVDTEQGLRTARRISHVFSIDAPAYPRPLFITDAAINVSPTLDDKRGIIQNAIDLAHVLGVAEPRVAILSAVETVTGKLRSTLDAAALCKMADCGQIKGGILDGPLAFDNALSEEAAKTKGIKSPVAGRADILVVPDLEAGNMLAKQLEYLAGAEIAGIVLGARVPIILTSRADKTVSRLASCAIALLLAQHTAGVKSSAIPFLCSTLASHASSFQYFRATGSRPQ
ncbi:bifunctional enoyl-CoA hydratase/phosphate acetyltransferase [Paraburkholderia oxyphila]|uniref:bifunctional enoyl-CoA hydratase/phosphate acetyltransferase n=1 Tax=Paraburkholderia oxyphila TaxID=614212 RepID=UPI0005BCBDEC|nr:bifunctional enoyl-CoA hydratase/phosphate acetyltransferase [Paraburkholderia oxyphila]